MKGWRKTSEFLAPEMAGGPLKHFYPDFR